MKHLKWAVIALVAALAFIAIRSCQKPDAKYIALKAEYAQLVKDTEAQHVLNLSTIVTQTEYIALKDAEIVEREKSIGAKNAQVAALKTTIRDLQAAEPEQPELETQPLVVSLRKQVKTLSDLYSISVEIIDNKDRVIADWTGKFNAQVVISEAWKQSYNNEHRLRLVSEDLNKTLAHQGKIDRFIGRVSMAGLAGAGAYILLTSLTK